MNPISTNSGSYLWPMGLNQPPLRTDKPEVPLLKQEEIDALNEVNEARVEILDLSKQDELTRYRGIIALITRGWAQLSAEERQWVPENKNWVVFIRYFLVFQTPNVR